MSPAFYDVPSPPLLVVAASSPATTSASRLPNLAVILGLICGLLVVTVAAGIYIYIFRGRHFLPEPVSEAKDGSGASFSGCFSVLEDDEVYQPPTPKAPALRPLLLCTTSTTSKNGQYKDLHLPRMQRERQFQSYQAVSRPGDARHRPLLLRPAATTRRTFPFGRRAPIPLPCKSSPIVDARPTLKISSSCPAGLDHKIRACTGDAPKSSETVQSGKDDHKTSSKDLKPANRLSRHLPADQLNASMSSASNEESDGSSSSEHSWDHYLNNRSDDLFYKPESIALLMSRPASELFEDDSECSWFDGLLLNTSQCEKSAASSTVEGTSKIRSHLFLRSLPPSKRPTRASARRKRPSVSALPSAVKLRTFIAAPISPRTRASVKTMSIMRTRPAKISAACKERHVKEGPIDGRSFKPEPKPVKASLGRRSKTRVPLTSKPPKKKRTPRARRPFGALTNVLGSSNTYSHAPAHPTLLLNGVPADDLERASTGSPSRTRHLPSPPRNPALLNIRWVPRAVPRALLLTVIVKSNSAHASACLGNTTLSSSSSSPISISITSSSSPSSWTSVHHTEDPDPGLRTLSVKTYAGNTLSQLRGAVEEALGYRAYLRGMVRVGTRELFLPLLTELFFRQWVNERVREGGVGTVEAWRKDC